MRRRFFNVKNSFNSNLNYFSIISLEDNSTVSLPTNTSPDLMYSLDGIDWTQWDYSTITLDKDDILYLKGNNSNGFSTSSSNYNKFSITGKVELSGNIMSLLYGDDFENNDTLPGTYTFCRLFYNCTGIISAENLILSATTLAKNCYYHMFNGCTLLTTAPELPATTLVDHCYYYMFYGCTSLVNSPALPATTLANYCYNYMFGGCTSLTTAPQLPATILASYCYYYMFNGCTSLTTALELPATTLATGCYQYMFNGCTSLTTAPALPATILASNCYRYMFQGCTSLTTAPELPATTLVTGCYYYMFRRCSNLNYIKMLATDISATNCLGNWVNMVAETGTFVKHPDMTTLPSGASGIPSGWTVEDVYITFTIDGIKYYAEEGMTWEDWVNSEYNTNPNIIIQHSFVYYTNNYFIVISSNRYSAIYSFAYITNNTTYVLEPV